MLRTLLIRVVVGLVALMALAVPASAQQWTTVFEPGKVQLTPEGYVQAREAAAWMAGFPPYRSSLTIIAYGEQTETGSGVGLRRARAMELELARLGVSEGYIRIAATVVSDAAADSRLIIYGQLSDRAQPPSEYIDQMLVYFGTGSVEVPEATKERLQLYIADYGPGENRLLVVGHTDTRGSIEANLRLSQDRAEAVARYLAGHGVRWDDMEIVAKGEAELPRATDDGVAEPLNRLVYVDMRGRSSLR